MGQTFQATSPLKVGTRFTAKNHVHSWEDLYQSLKFWIFAKYFSFSLKWDHMGVKVSNDISPERAHQICSAKFMDTPGEGLYQSCSKNR